MPGLSQHIDKKRPFKYHNKKEDDRKDKPMLTYRKGTTL